MGNVSLCNVSLCLGFPPRHSPSLYCTVLVHTVQAAILSFWEGVHEAVGESAYVMDVLYLPSEQRVILIEIRCTFDVDRGEKMMWWDVLGALDV